MFEHFDLKTLSGLISFALMLGGSIPYIRAVFRKETTPHVFSWVIWHLVDDIAVAAQLTAGAGAGIWATAAGALCSFFVCFLAIKGRQAITISKTDWVIFIITLAAIPVWIVTKEPLSAALIATAINAAAFLITMRKIWHAPQSENATAYIMYFVGWLFGILALDAYNLTSALYPAVGMLMNGLTFALIFLRRRLTRKPR